MLRALHRGAGGAGGRGVRWRGAGRARVGRLIEARLLGFLFLLLLLFQLFSLLRARRWRLGVRLLFLQVMLDMVGCCLLLVA